MAAGLGVATHAVERRVRLAAAAGEESVKVAQGDVLAAKIGLPIDLAIGCGKIGTDVVLPGRIGLGEIQEVGLRSLDQETREPGGDHFLVMTLESAVTGGRGFHAGQFDGRDAGPRHRLRGRDWRRDGDRPEQWENEARGSGEAHGARLENRPRTAKAAPAAMRQDG